jgi:enamine deaminase RidA (YjgF/YER057c/UK114 family)
MTLECINPKDLPTPQTYSQVVVGTGSKMVFVSGQEPEDIHGKLVGLGDLATQALRGHPKPAIKGHFKTGH